MSAINIGQYPAPPVSQEWIGLEATCIQLNGLLVTLQEESTIQQGEITDIVEGYESLNASLTNNIIKMQYYQNPFERINVASQYSVPVGVEQTLCTFTSGFKSSLSGDTATPVAWVGAYLDILTAAGSGNVKKIEFYIKEVATNSIIQRDVWFGSTANNGRVSRSIITYINNTLQTTKYYRVSFLITADPLLTACFIRTTSFGWLIPLDPVY
jgi:hypothetical protein